MAELHDRRGRAVDALVSERQLRIEPVVGLMRAEQRAGEALIAARCGRRIRRRCVAAASAAGEAGRRVRRQQRGVVFDDGLVAKVQLHVAVPVRAAQLVAQLGEDRVSVRVAADSSAASARGSSD